MKTIIVVGRDWKFQALLRAQLREEGYEALAFETLQDAEAERAGAALLVFDTSEVNTGDWATTLQRLAAQLPVIVVAGADNQVDVTSVRVLRRPVRIDDIISVVRSLTSAGP